MAINIQALLDEALAEELAADAVVDAAELQAALAADELADAAANAVKDAEITALIAEVTALEEENDDLAEVNVDLIEDVNILTTQVGVLEAQIVSLEDMVDGLETEKTALEAQVVSVVEENGVLTLARTNLQNQINALNAQIVNLNATIVTLQNQIANAPPSGPIPYPTFVVSDSATKAEASGPAVFTVTMTPAATKAVLVDYSTVNGTATAGTDYTATSGTLTFAVGETSKVVNVPLLNDTAVESNEVFTLVLSNARVPLVINDASGSVTVTSEDVVVVPPPTNTIPLSYSAAQFSGNTASNAITIPSGGTRSNLSITDTGGIASILTGDGATINNCRVASREALRIGGSGTFNINNSYLEAVGTGADHADAIQCYAPGDSGTINITNSALVIGGASNAGFFIADNWVPATVNLTNVAFIAKPGGQTGLKLHADSGGNVILSMKDVFFVGPFANTPFSFVNYGGGSVIVQKWENVRNATIVNGALVPGTLIASPIAVTPPPTGLPTGTVTAIADVMALSATNTGHTGTLTNSGPINTT